MNGAKHEQRDSDGHCRCETCGYDLHANQSGQCPECGATGGAVRMPPQWRILIVALAVPMTLLLLWTVWSMVSKLR